MASLHAGGEGLSKEASARAGALAGLLDTLVALAALALSNSSVVMADFLKTTLEFVAVLMSWLAIRRMERGGNHQYEYGMDKLENLSSLLVGLLMLGCLAAITTGAILDILHPEPVAGAGVWIALVAQVFFGIINLRVYHHSRAQAASSPLAASQARLFLTRCLGNAFIFTALSLSLLLEHRLDWADYIDPAASLVIAASILAASLGIFSSSIYDLLDRSLEEEDQLVILRALAGHFHEYKDLHGIRSRRSGGRAFIDIFLEFDPFHPVGQVQETVDRLRQAIEASIPGSRVTIGLATSRVV